MSNYKRTVFNGKPIYIKRYGYHDGKFGIWSAIYVDVELPQYEDLDSGYRLTRADWQRYEGPSLTEKELTALTRQYGAELVKQWDNSSSFWLNERGVDIGDISHSRDSCDSYIEDAIYIDDGTPLNEDELNELTEKEGDYLYDAHQDYMIGQAEYYSDMERDR